MIVGRARRAVPADMEALERLPGVGHKTASVVMSQAFGVPAFPVDTHIHRLAQRWGLSSGKNVVQTEKDLKRLFPGSTGTACTQRLFLRAPVLYRPWLRRPPLRDRRTCYPGRKHPKTTRKA